MNFFKESKYGIVNSNWKYIPAIEFCSRITDGTHDSPKEQLNGKYLITSRHIKSRNIDFVNAYFISEEDFDKINKRSKVDQWDVIISMIGEYCGFCYVERNEFIDYAVKNVGLFKTEHKDKALWLYYFLNSRIGKSIIEENKSGTSQPYLTLGFLRELQILIPNSEQELLNITQLLSSLDDKIDLIYRQNTTLEHIAETLFRQWFVEEAEEDWEVETLENVFDIGIGRTPPRKEQHWFTTNPNDVKWISIKDMGNEGIYVNSVSEFLTEEAVQNFNIPIIPKNTVLLSFKMTIGRLAITSERMLSNEAIAHFKLKQNSIIFPEYLYLYLKSFRFEQLGSTSSIVESINSQMIKEMEIIIPNKEKLNEFEIIVKPLFEKIKVNQIQTQTLTKLRDTLLPKLMSGEVKVDY